MPDEAPIKVEVAYATPERQLIVPLEVPPGTTLGEAVSQSGISGEFPGMDLSADNFGVFSRKQTPDYVLRAGDRVEIYRPLIADPKEVRRKKAQEQAGD